MTYKIYIYRDLLKILFSTKISGNIDVQAVLYTYILYFWTTSFNHFLPLLEKLAPTFFPLNYWAETKEVTKYYN